MPVRQGYIKNICNDLMKKYSGMITTDFELNKQLLNEIAEIQTKKLRNRIAGMLVIYKKNEGRVIIPPRKGRPKKRKGWKRKEKNRLRRMRRNK